MDAMAPRLPAANTTANHAIKPNTCERRERGWAANLTMWIYKSFCARDLP